MADKKIVDDYYIQNVESETPKTESKKEKIFIKGKIKVKKVIDTFVAEKQKGEVSKEITEIKEVVESPKEKQEPEKVYFQEEKQKNHKNNTQPNIQSERKNVDKKYSVGKKENKEQKTFSSQGQKETVQTDTEFPKKGGYFTKKWRESHIESSNNASISTKKEKTQVIHKNTVGEIEEERKDKTSFLMPSHPLRENDNKNDGVSKFSKKNFKNFDDKEKKGKSKFVKKDKKTKYSKSIVSEEDEVSFFRSSKIKNKVNKEKLLSDIVQNLTERTGETVIISNVLSVKEFSEKIGVPLPKIIAEFMKNGMRVTVNSKLDFDTASIIADVFGVKLQKDISSGFQVEDLLSESVQTLLGYEDKENLVPRPPVISIMGHVDHGKTSLLDYIRKTKVVDKEEGGITQSIGAYQVEYNGKKITFLDTPGHEAFTLMRTRGAKSTDIAILVVAADEGVKPQTIESIHHAKEAGIPIAVAINKMDKPGANVENVKTQLSSYGILSEDWGGDVPMIPVSAKMGTGIDDLLEIIFILSEMLELKANPNRFAVATVIESHLDVNLGPVATILLNAGTIRKGDAMVCRGAFGKVKVLKDYLSKNVSQAGPADPVLVVGLDSVVEGGDILQVVPDIEKAREKATQYKVIMESKKVFASSSIETIMSKIKSGNLKQLKMVVKADTNGSLEAIKGALFKLSNEDIKLHIVYSGVGNITEGDVVMCQGLNTLLVGFNVSLLGTAKNLIDEGKIEYISSKIIYRITEKIEKIVTGMLDPKEVEVVLGKATVGGIFYEEKGFMILGLKLKSNSKIVKGAQIRVIRGDKVVGKGIVENLKSGITDVHDIEGPGECGIRFKSEFKAEMGDIFELFVVEIQK